MGSKTDGMRGRVALITGGGRGIGRAIALRLAGAGADIAITFARDEQAALGTVEEARAFGVRAEAFQGRVESWDDCVSVVDRAVEKLGSIGILVVNGGIGSRGHTVADTDPAELERVVAIHSFGSFYMAQLAVPHLRQHARSDMIFISSTGTRQINGRGAPYVMGKAGMEALAQTLAKEERANGIRVNVVAPTMTATEMGQRLSRATSGVQDIRELDSKSPFGRVCLPEDVASIVNYLVSDENFYISGQRIAVDGASGG